MASYAKRKDNLTKGQFINTRNTPGAQAVANNRMIMGQNCPVPAITGMQANTDVPAAPVQIHLQQNTGLWNLENLNNTAEAAHENVGKHRIRSHGRR